MASSDLISDLLRNTDNATESEKSAATSARVESPAVISAPEKEISPEEMKIKVDELRERLAMTDFPGNGDETSEDETTDDETLEDESDDETDDESDDETSGEDMEKEDSGRRDDLEKLRERIMGLNLEKPAAARYKAEPRNALYTTRSKVNQVKQMMDQRRIANSRRVRDTRVPRKLETISNTSRTPPVSDEEYARLIKLAR